MWRLDLLQIPEVTSQELNLVALQRLQPLDLRRAVNAKLPQRKLDP